jgi:formyltetrahydrofolate deformylase
MSLAARLLSPPMRGDQDALDRFNLQGDVNAARLFVLTLDCPGSREVIGRITTGITALGVGIDETEYHSDPVTGRFFARLILRADSGEVTLDRLRGRLPRIAHGLGGARWRIRDGNVRARAVILVSGDLHCLRDVLRRTNTGELAAEVAAVIGNHRTAAAVLDGHDVPFHYVEFPKQGTPDRVSRRKEAFTWVEHLVDAYAPDVIILARFMQILPEYLCSNWAGRAINIHHSILPAFAGANPYRQAHLRGVKLIGATCHYVTPDLDAGPIIEQDVIRVAHTDTVADMIRRGRAVECAVLSRGLQWHVEDRVFINGAGTVVLEPQTRSSALKPTTESVSIRVMSSQ